MEVIQPFDSFVLEQMHLKHGGHSWYKTTENKCLCTVNLFCLDVLYSMIPITTGQLGLPNNACFTNATIMRENHLSFQITFYNNKKKE